MEAKKKFYKVNLSMTADDVALIKRLKRNLLPSTGALTQSALVRLALRKMATEYGVKA